MSNVKYNVQGILTKKVPRILIKFKKALHLQTYLTTRNVLCYLHILRQVISAYAMFILTRYSLVKSCLS